MNSSVATTTSLRDIVAILFRRLRSMTLIFIVTIGIAAAWQLLIHEEVYETSAKLLIKIGREQTQPVTMLGEPTTVVGYRQQDVNSEVEILKNMELIAKTVDKLGLDKRVPPPVPEGIWQRVRYEVRRFVSDVREWVDELLITAGFRPRLSDREKAIATLEQGLSVSTQGDSNVIVARLRLPARESVAGILNALVELYMESRLRLFQDAGAIKLFEEQAQEMRSRLEQAEEGLRHLERQADIVALNAQKEILLRRAAETQTELNGEAMRLAEINAKSARLREQISRDDPDIGVLGGFQTESYQDTVARNLTDLQKERVQLRMTEFDSGVRVQNNRRQFSALAGIMLSNLESVTAERRAIVEAHNRTLAELQRKLGSLHAREIDWVQLKREIRILEQRYEFYQKKHEDAVATLAMERSRVGNVAVVQNAQDPLRPAGLRRITFLMIATLFAALAALSWVTLAEFLDHRVYAVDEAARLLGAPAITAIPFDRSRAGEHIRKEFVERIDDRFREPALVLMKSLNQSNARSVAFSGTGSGAGTASAVLQIAQHVRSIYGSRVAVIELDTHRPKLLRALGLDPSRSLEAYGRGEFTLSECLQDGPRGVKVMGADGREATRAEPGVARLSTLLSDLEQAFDCILLDMPPILERADVLAAGQVVPRVVIVVEAGKARYEMLQRIRVELAREGITLLGAILNKQPRSIPNWAYRIFVQ